MGWGIIGFIAGLFVCLVMVAHAMHGTADSCRAAHPGYDCDLGWVQGDAFK
jgi:hypothetical protein